LAAWPSVALAAEVEASDGDASIALSEQKAAQAFEAYQAKHFAEAVGLYLEAHAAAPNADILYNVARIYDAKLGDRPLAINFYRRYITDPGAVADRIQVANERLLALRDAELAVAERPAPAPSAAPDSLPPATTTTERRPALAMGWTTGEWAGAILAGTGVVALGLGTGFGVAAMDDTRTVRDLCDGNLCREQRGIDAAETATDHARVSTIAFASGGALLALGAAFYFWPGGESRERPEQASASGWELAGAGVAPTVDGWSLEVTGTW
jgi:tetratricopeptide (TPR) repeat protein